MLSGAKQSSSLGDLHPDVLQVLLRDVPVLAVHVLRPLDVLRRQTVDQLNISGRHLSLKWRDFLYNLLVFRPFKFEWFSRPFHV